MSFEDNILNYKIGDRYFEEVRTVRLVEIVAQRDDPPGRPDRKRSYTTLAESQTRLNAGEQLRDRIEEVNHA